jgi:hypothetical protein
MGRPPGGPSCVLGRVERRVVDATLDRGRARHGPWLDGAGSPWLRARECGAARVWRSLRDVGGASRESRPVRRARIEAGVAGGVSGAGEAGVTDGAARGLLEQHEGLQRREGGTKSSGPAGRWRGEHVFVKLRFGSDGTGGRERPWLMTAKKRVRAASAVARAWPTCEIAASGAPRRPGPRRSMRRARYVGLCGHGSNSSAEHAPAMRRVRTCRGRAVRPRAATRRRGRAARARPPAPRAPR